MGMAMKTREKAEMDMPTIMRLTVEKRPSTGMSRMRPETMMAGLMALMEPMAKSSYRVRT